MLYNTTRHRGTRIALAVLGSLIYSVGINYFVTPAGLYTGGFLSHIPFPCFQRIPLCSHTAQDSHLLLQILALKIQHTLQ